MQDQIEVSGYRKTARTSLTEAISRNRNINPTSTVISLFGSRASFISRPRTRNRDLTFGFSPCQNVRRAMSHLDKGGVLTPAHLHAPSAGMEDPKAIGVLRISINDLNRRPRPLPNADAWRAGELYLPAGAFHRDTRPIFGNARPVHAVRTQHIG